MLLANIVPHIHDKPGYHVLKDFAPVTLLATGPTVLVVGPSLPVRNVKELITLARAKPGLLKYGSGGSGTPAHLTTEMLRMMTGIDRVTWWDVVVPRATPEGIIRRLNASLHKSLEFADTRERVAALGIDVQASSPVKCQVFMAAELARYGRMAKQVGLKSE